jgi:6-phosphogluconolactonase (cycloisomerase 2 family)
MLRHRWIPAAATALLIAMSSTVSAHAQTPTTVYTTSNAATGNQVLAFTRRPSGNLEAAGTFATGGLGTGGSLGNQSGIVLDPSDRWLFVVNAGDGTVSSFQITETGLTLVDTEPSGGVSAHQPDGFPKLALRAQRGESR